MCMEEGEEDAVEMGRKRSVGEVGVDVGDENAFREEDGGEGRWMEGRAIWMGKRVRVIGRGKRHG